MGKMGDSMSRTTIWHAIITCHYLTKKKAMNISWQKYGLVRENSMRNGYIDLMSLLKQYEKENMKPILK